MEGVPALREVSSLDVTVCEEATLVEIDPAGSSECFTTANCETALVVFGEMFVLLVAVAGSAGSVGSATDATTAGGRTSVWPAEDGGGPDGATSPFTGFL